MKIIGVCGKSGSGKSTFAQKMAKQQETEYVDVDAVVHKILERDAIRQSVVGILGTDSFINDGKINRRALGEILFTDKDLMTAYNRAIYGEIEKELDDDIAKAKQYNNDIIIDWALLPMSKYYAMCDKKYLIKKSEEARQRVVTRRDGVADEYFKKRENNSLAYNEKDFDEIIEMKFSGFFAGSFDPFTMGHLDIVRQAKRDFDKIVVGIAQSEKKLRRYDRESMKTAIKQTLDHEKIDGVDCIAYAGMTGEQAISLNCPSLIRGIRDENDMEYETQVAKYNKEHYDLNTVYYQSPDDLKNISSSQVKHLLRRNQTIDAYVPAPIRELII